MTATDEQVLRVDSLPESTTPLGDFGATADAVAVRVVRQALVTDLVADALDAVATPDLSLVPLSEVGLVLSPRGPLQAAHGYLVGATE